MKRRGKGRQRETYKNAKSPQKMLWGGQRFTSSSVARSTDDDDLYLVSLFEDGHSTSECRPTEHADCNVSNQRFFDIVVFEVSWWV